MKKITVLILCVSILVSLFVPSMVSAATSSLKPVELTWYFVGSPQADADKVFAAANKIVKSKINATVNFNCLDWNSYNDKMKLMTAAGENYDLCFTANWMNQYQPNVSKNAFLALDTLLPKYAPNVMKLIPSSFWNATKVKGKIYAVPNYQISTSSVGIWFKKDLVDKYKFDIKKVKTYKDLAPYLQTIKDNEPNIIPLEMFNKGFWGKLLIANGYDGITGMFAMINTKAPGSVVNSFALPEFKKYLDTARDWYKKGYVEQDVISRKDAINTPEEKAGKYACGWVNAMKPGDEAEKKAAWGYDVVEIPMGQAIVSTGSITATMTAVSKTSKNPERAVMFIDLINSDKNLYNTVCYGLPNVHYKKLSANRIEPIKGSKYAPGLDWEFGCQFNAYLTPGKADDVWQQTIKMNNAAKPSPVLGFNFDPEKVSAEIAQCQSVDDEYMPGVACGAIDYKQILPAMLDKMNKSGLKKIHTEVVSQLKAWNSKVQWKTTVR